MAAAVLISSFLSKAKRQQCDSCGASSLCHATLSNRLRDLPRLFPTSLLVQKLLPADRNHLVARLAHSHDNSKFILRRAAEIAPLVSQTDDHSSHNISHPEALRDLDFVDLCRANVLLTDDGRERVTAGVLAGDSEGENREVGLSRVGARDATEDDCAGLGN